MPARASCLGAGAMPGRTAQGGSIVLIVVLAVWLVAISVVLRFLSVSSSGEARCGACSAELELFPESRRCPDCGASVRAPPQNPARVHRVRRDDEHEAIHTLVAAVVQGGLHREPRGERGLPPSPPMHYPRASSGSTLSAKSRTLS